MLPLHLLTIFLGASLLFLVQPLIGRMVLPAYGGSPAVWNACMLFFQSVLLAGYLLVHLLSGRSLRVQAAVAALLLLAGAISLPFVLDAARGARGEGSPLADLLMALGVTAGLPFLAVSIASPLVQRWFAASGHRRSSDPYFLYAASNAGSMVGLLVYPFLLERLFPVAGQAMIWTILYALFALLLMVCAAAGIRGGGSSRRGAPASAASTPDDGSPVPGTSATSVTIGLWVLLAFVPSSLLLSVTAFITTDLVVVPLLWVIPLALYLLSYMLAFATRVRDSGNGRPRREGWLPLAPLRRAVPIAIVSALILYVSGATEPMWLIVLGHLAVLFVIATASHGELAARRPPVHQLTGFYLAISIGGAMGGLFNALLAPVLFSGMAEYPLTLIAAAALLPALGPAVWSAPVIRLVVQGSGVVLGLLLLTFLLQRTADMLALPVGPPRLAIAFGLPLVLAYLASRRPLRFAAALAAVLVAGYPALGPPGDLLERSRSFHGIHRVIRAPIEPLPGQLAPTLLVHALFHGTTLHGKQLVDAETGRPEQPQRPIAYYTRPGPIGDVITRLPAGNVGVVGLGAGALAAYADAGDRMTFFEIDPDVVRLAEDQRFFTYLSAARARGAELDIVLGDARLTLQEVAPETFDLLVIDAFSSDSVPAHLLTREAIALYMRSLRPGGVLAMHISNRYLDLEPVVANLAEDAGLFAVMRTDLFSIDSEDADAGRLTSMWAVLAAEEEALAMLVQERSDVGWRTMQSRPRIGIWTDDWWDPLRVFLR